MDPLTMMIMTISLYDLEPISTTSVPTTEPATTELVSTIHLGERTSPVTTKKKTTDDSENIGTVIAVVVTVMVIMLIVSSPINPETATASATSAVQHPKIHPRQIDVRPCDHSTDLPPVA